MVAFCLLLAYLEKIETTTSLDVNIATVFEKGSQDTLMAHAKQRAREVYGSSIFRAPEPASGLKRDSSGDSVFNGSFTRGASPCITFNLGIKQHPASSLDSGGKCKYSHTCDQWVSGKGPKGICGSDKHHRKSCDNPDKVDKPASE